jgi:hypothetical protein
MYQVGRGAQGVGLIRTLQTFLEIVALEVKQGVMSWRVGCTLHYLPIKAKVKTSVKMRNIHVFYGDIQCFSRKFNISSRF